MNWINVLIVLVLANDDSLVHLFAIPVRLAVGPYRVE
jgi:hypothetical protein